MTPLAGAGLLVAFEGPDGSGKTTQRKLFKTWLKAEGYDVVTTKWNSSDLIKPIIKSRKAVRALSPEEFSLLHAADFRHRVEHKILPALWSGQAGDCGPVPVHGPGARLRARSGSRLGPASCISRCSGPTWCSISPSRQARRASASRRTGRRITTKPARTSRKIDDPTVSYERFITRVIREYESLAVIFNFITVDAEQSIGEQHHAIRKLFRDCEQRAWSDSNADAVAEWLMMRGGPA